MLLLLSLENEVHTSVCVCTYVKCCFVESFNAMLFVYLSVFTFLCGGNIFLLDLSTANVIVYNDATSILQIGAAFLVELCFKILLTIYPYNLFIKNVHNLNLLSCTLMMSTGLVLLCPGGCGT